MISQTKKIVYRLLLGAFMLSFVVVACKNSKEKKEETPKETTTIEVTTPPVDTTKMDTVDTRPVKPAD